MADLDNTTKRKLESIFDMGGGYVLDFSKDEDRPRQKWGRLGGIAVTLSDEKQSTKAWATRAIGEERLGTRLDSLVSVSIAVLHDRRIPGTKSNIDHIFITQPGIWVIDAKRYKSRPELKVEGGLLRPRVEKVLVGRRDCTKLVDGVLKQVDLVRDNVGDVPVTGACVSLRQTGRWSAGPS